jgi:hypothetical protein
MVLPTLLETMCEKIRAQHTSAAVHIPLVVRSYGRPLETALRAGQKSNLEPRLGSCHEPQQRVSLLPLRVSLWLGVIL